jgi:hypothetical protein
MRLPVDIAEGVTLEDVYPLLTPDHFDRYRCEIGTSVAKRLQGIRHALIHRFDTDPEVDAEKEHILTESMKDADSKQRVTGIRALLRLIRPTREEAQSVHGYVLADKSFDVMGFQHPVLISEVPENQKLFSIRNKDVEELRILAPAFLRAMSGEYWEFRMAAQFHDLGHYQNYDHKARYLLWMSAIEGLFTSVDEQGSNVAKARIKWFLGEHTQIYPKGEIYGVNPAPEITILDVMDDLYLMRNCISHGDRLNDKYFAIRRQDLFGGLPLFGVLTEAASFIIRYSLLKILRENLLEHFRNSDTSSAYFAANGLSAPDIDRMLSKTKRRK